MEGSTESILFLAAYFVIFFWKFLKNPYLLCTSELASTFFPHWIWVGRELREGRFPAQDDIYYKLPGSIPFLSTFYPPNLIASYLGSFLNLDSAFRLYVYFILSHYLLGSVLSYFLFLGWCEPLVALFGALTLTYSAYCIKPQTPAFVYTITWVPLALMGNPIGMMMSLLGGYYPVLVYAMPVIFFLQPIPTLIGIFLALPQLIPFLGYYKNSVRNGGEVDKKVGRIPFKKLVELVLPIQGYAPVNGVHYPEVAMYMGIAILQLSWSLWNLVTLVAVLIVLGVIPAVQRIPSRGLYLLTLSICMALRKDLYPPLLLALQGFLLLKNSSLYPSFPFSQWWDKPSILYSKSPKANNWPFATGYLEGRRISEYRGAFRLRE